MTDQDPAALARRIIDDNLYLVLGTADGTGQPWAAPVYYAVEAYREFYWVSRPQARHSRNIAARPGISIVIFDSRVPVNQGQAVYLEARAEQVTGADLDRGIAVFSRRSQAHGAGEWAPARVREPAELRLYRANVSEHSVLLPGGPDRRTRVTL